MNGKLLTLGVFLAASVAGYVGAQYAIPRVIMDAAITGMAARGSINSMAHGNLATPENQPIVRPSPDLAYSTCPYDLSAGPVRVHIEPVAGRYSSLSIFDGQTDVAFVRNDLQAKSQPYEVMIARAGQVTPPGAEVVRVDQDRGIALVRLLLATPAEIKTVQPQRERSWCKPLSAG